MVAWQLPAELVAWIVALSGPPHGRLAWRLLPLPRGMLFAQGRRTVARWLRAAALGKDFPQFYYFLGSLGPRAGVIAAVLPRLAVGVIVPGERLLFGLDDTPTKRYGPHVEGAGVHHNPTPGPAEQKSLYGHVWVTLAWLVRHPLWGAIGLPPRAWLYVRRQDVGQLPRWYRVTFRTKLEMAAEAVAWLADWLKHPRPGAPKRRGRRPKYGKEKVSLAKRAGRRCGWQTADCTLYGATATKTFKTFLATYPPAGGLIRVVLVRELDGWVAFFCTDPQATVAQVLEAVADRAAVEQDFHDLKEVHGAGQQQVRHYWANVAVFHLNLWLHTLIELWAWTKTQGQLCDRRDRS